MLLSDQPVWGFAVHGCNQSLLLITRLFQLRNADQTIIPSTLNTLHSANSSKPTSNSRWPNARPPHHPPSLCFLYPHPPPMIPIIQHLPRKRLQHLVRIIPCHRPPTHRDHERCDTKNNLVHLTRPIVLFEEWTQSTVRADVGHHLQADGEDACHDVPARKRGARSGESEAVGRIGHGVGVGQWVCCLQHIASDTSSLARWGSGYGEEHYLFGCERRGGTVGGAAIAGRAPATVMSSGRRLSNFLLSPLSSVSGHD